ncbi:hypothetical protein F4808DRAFT_449353 [Astrocystis sublimbata]|nr:hypothetical protein F4808DRAFT_449353 [Astrocystis sublimbata]
MEDGSFPGSPGGDTNYLQPISPDRVNHQNPMLASFRTSAQRDSDVHDKIRQFNNLAHLQPGASSMSKQLERKTADAALRRAMIGREEAESEMRRYREEARALRRQVDDGHERERKVGERLETVMESYGRAKETYSHTQAIWEKEIRRARKETFKSQSSILKLQEELKSARMASKAAEECLEREKELSKAREQEAFSARYQLVELQQELDKAQERVLFLEKERDAFKAAAQSEEIARIAAEGHLPLPPEDPDSEFASPRKSFQGRESFSTFDIVSSAATEAELDELTRLWQWEKQRADRTQDHLDFLQTESELRRSQRKQASSFRRSVTSSARKSRTVPIEIVDPSDLVILGQDTSPSKSTRLTQTIQPTSEEETEIPAEPQVHEPEPDSVTEDAQAKGEEPPRLPDLEEPRRGTIFLPAEGTFRTISQQEYEAMHCDQEDDATPQPPSPVRPQPEIPRYARTPSVEPPTFALLAQERTSLLSLLNAPRESEANVTAFKIPSTVGETSTCAIYEDNDDDSDKENNDNVDATPETNNAPDLPATTTETPSDLRPHTSADFYTVTTTTTTVPIQDGPAKPLTAFKSRKANAGDVNGNRTPSFDVNNPALTPTMTREQALAQIRERRGRARSAMQGAMTPRRQMVTGVTDRNVSAPAGRAAKGRS